MEMSSNRVIAAPRALVWKALNDPETLKRCIAGCDRIEATGEHQYEVAMSIKIGPVSAKFKGVMTLKDIVPERSYSIDFEGQGGLAGFASGSSSVELVEVEDGTDLRYRAQAKVGGKLAQLGSRLIDTSARKMADDFFKRFVTLFEERKEEAAQGGAA